MTIDNLFKIKYFFETRYRKEYYLCDYNIITNLMYYFFFNFIISTIILKFKYHNLSFLIFFLNYIIAFINFISVFISIS